MRVKTLEEIKLKFGKVWGYTEQIHSNSLFEFHRIEVLAGGICSKHKHRYKWNGFFVESGELIVRVWKNDYDLVDSTVLKDGEWSVVKPGEFHQFEAIKPCVAFEIYWAEFNSDDIVRETKGLLQSLTNKK